jgi:nucleotide-binding universal stress UspA family protein
MPCIVRGRTHPDEGPSAVISSRPHRCKDRGIGKEPDMTATEGALGARVVVGVDGSEPSKLALRWGAFLATTLGARLEAVVAWQTPATYGWAAFDWNPEQEMGRVLDETLSEVFGEQAPVPVHRIVREGGAAPVLLEVTKGANMIVVGSRGRGGFVGLLLGSVSSSVAEHAPCPVLVVHGDRNPPGFAG